MLTDQSATEQQAVRSAFGMFLYSFIASIYKGQSIGDFPRKYSGFSEARRHFASVIYAYQTREEAERSEGAAIRAALTNRDKVYFRQECRTGPEQRAYLSRCLVAILLQTPTTKFVEGWYKALKDERSD